MPTKELEILNHLWQNPNINATISVQRFCDNLKQQSSKLIDSTTNNLPTTTTLLDSSNCANTSGQNNSNNLTDSVKNHSLDEEVNSPLCKIQSFLDTQEHNLINGNKISSTGNEIVSSENKMTANCDDEDEELQSDEDDMHIEMEDETRNDNNTDGISSDNLAVIERIRQNQHRNYQNPDSYSLQASDRLLKELREVFRCDSLHRKVFEVHLVNDNLYEWNVHLKKVDPDSQLSADLQALKERDGRDYIILNVLFKENYPFEPPFIRVAYPHINGGYVLGGGALCMELLTKQVN